MSSSLYCYPSDIVQGTWSVTSGAADSAYPVANLGDLKAYKPFKATASAVTVRATFGGSQTLGACAFIVHNAAGTTVTITNGAGLSTTLAFPANTGDGLSVNAYKNFSGLANLSSTTWTFAFTGLSANVAIGEILLISTVRTTPLRWGFKPGSDYPIDEQTTELGVPLIYEHGVRTRTLRARVSRETERAAIEALRASAVGRARQWWLAPDSSVNDCLFVRFADSKWEYDRNGPNETQMPVDVEEAGLGPAL